jgi:acetolactate synthase-1/2/3 large subunit
MIEGQKREGAKRAEATKDALKETIHPGYQAFLDSLQEALPDCILIGDSTQPAYFAAAQYDAQTPRSFASAATGYGTLGYALPAAFGAKLGQPERPVIGLLGDGGVQFTLNELATAVEAEIPVAIIIWNNECYGQIAMNFRDSGMEPIACDIYTPNFITIAEGYGCHTATACDLKELGSALKEAHSKRVPTLIEVREEDFISQN